MEREEVIGIFHKEIQAIYKEQDLTCIRGLSGQYNLNGRQVLQWYHQAVHKGKKEYGQEFDFNAHFNDILFCSDEIMYFLANMYMYRPFMNNPVEDSFSFAGGMSYPNYENLGAKRYSMFASSVGEKLYNYWDRIGDLLAAYFPTLINPKRVYFATTIDIIPKEYHESENYIWLKSFRDNEYKQLNEKRQKQVHHITHNTEFSNAVLTNQADRGIIELTIQEREGLADFYRNQMMLTLTGLEKTLLLIEEITEKTLILKGH